MTVPQQSDQGLAARIRLLSLFQSILAIAVALILIGIAFAGIIPWYALPAGVGGCGIHLLSSLLLYTFHRSRYAMLAVYMHLIVMQCIIALADSFAGETHGNTWFFFQLATPIVALVLQQPRATLIMTAITILFLITTVILYTNQIIPATLLLKPGDLYFNIVVQIIVLLGLAVSTNRIGHRERLTMTSLSRAQRQLTTQLHDLEVLSIEKDWLNKGLAQQIIEIQNRDVQIRKQIEYGQQLQQTIRDFSIPIIPVAKGTIVVPLIGTIDTIRAQSIIDNLLHETKALGTKYVIIDVTGLLSIDTLLAETLVLIAKSVRLLGARTALVGMRPEMALALARLKPDELGFETYISLQDAVSSHIMPASDTVPRSTML